MGYNLYITKKGNYDDQSDINIITLDEWLEYVKNDPEMRLDNFMEAKKDGETVLRLDEQGIAVWEKYSKEGFIDGHAWFWYDHGNVGVKNPDREIIQKMKEISKKMNAKVQGEELETY